MTFARHSFSPAELAEQLELERRGLPFLVLRNAENVLLLVALEGDRMTVGREPGSDIELAWDPEVSRLHALLERLGGSWTVADEDLSRNGTYVNGTRVRGRRRLGDRDVLRFGATEALYRNPGVEADETPPVAAGAAVAEVTPAQQRVLVGLCRPLMEADQPGATPPSNREIADELTVSVEAVRTQMKALFRLFEVPDLPQNRKRAELARRALAAGVVTTRDLER